MSKAQNAGAEKPARLQMLGSARAHRDAGRAWSHFWQHSPDDSDR
eukprot:CAMPEP_0172179682 /NCGR_PEP_ID=MMETSP1050-20130122/16765_1 /TAXON_ID=233186 /ORGANISM="Cryptomonas curvata, Strain CCAP979/52" /LENGTH=44 /DNA_ID= /DNA_START= /DNA_END= /DNA_ORIENTATION=